MEERLCYGCMEEKGAAAVCPHCDYEDGTAFPPNCIEPGTILHSRYLVGKMLNSNGEGITYIGFDQVVSCKVFLREYMPGNLCTRVKGKPVISVNYNNVTQYKNYMADFTELNKSLAKMRNMSNVIPVLDIFSENNTTYVVFEHFDSITLMEHIKDNAGELSWEQVSRLFPTLFTSMSILHNTGIWHRGISPTTIVYGNKGELRLQGFCISGIRTVNDELDSEVFTGYAAPEQYSPHKPIGTWTDVYGICATLYRALTGSMPTDAHSREENDNLRSPHEMNSNIPKNISDVIMKGLELDSEARIQTLTDLVMKLFEQQPEPEKRERRHETGSRAAVPPPKKAGETMTFKSNPADEDMFYDGKTAPIRSDLLNDAYRKRKPRNDDDEYIDEYITEDADKKDNLERVKVAVIVGILLFAILMVIVAVLLSIINPKPPGLPEDTSPSTYETLGTFILTDDMDDNLMRPLVGYDFDVMANTYKDFMTLDPIEQYNDEYPKNIIFKQEIEPGRPYIKGSVIQVWVSKGPQNVTIPNHSNTSMMDYIKLLDELDIKYETKSEMNSDIPEGFVTRVLKQSGLGGNTFDLLGTDKLIVYYVKNGAATTAATTAATKATSAGGTTRPATQTPQPTQPQPTQPQPTQPQPTQPATLPPVHVVT